MEGCDPENSRSVADELMQNADMSRVEIRYLMPLKLVQ